MCARETHKACIAPDGLNLKDAFDWYCGYRTAAGKYNAPGAAALEILNQKMCDLQ
jgi:hypothetical protein